jgi:hypothetical protein
MLEVEAGVGGLVTMSNISHLREEDEGGLEAACN